MKRALCVIGIILALCLLSSPALAADGVPDEALAAHMPLVVVACLLAAILLAAVGILIYRSRRQTLAKLMQRRLTGYSAGQALEMIVPLLGSLQTLHARGLVHGGIYPDHVYVGRMGRLHLGRPVRRVKLLPGTKPYLPAEQYDFNSLTGTYSDVYALGALLYALIFGRPPADMMQRMQCDSLADELDAADIPASMKNAIYDAMRINAAERIQDVFSLAKALEIEPVRLAGYLRTGFIIPKREKKPLIIAIALSAAVILVLAIAVGWIITERKYSEALGYTDDWEFAQAQEQLNDVFPFYKDIKRLSDYVKAGELLNSGYYAEAKAIFIELGDYKESELLLKECNYKIAKTIMYQGRAKEAKAILTALGGYRDSVALIKEAEYQEAVLSYRNLVVPENSVKSVKDAENSLRLFRNLGNYSESEVYLSQTQAVTYAYAKKIFATNIDTASDFFKLIPDYKDSSQYIAVYDLTLMPVAAGYQGLRKLWNFEPARQIILDNGHIHYFLKGTWRGDGHFLRFTSDSDDQFSSDYDIPWIDGEYYKIDELIYYAGSDESGWRKMFTFTIIDEDTMTVYAHENGKTYQLRRQ